MAEQRPLVRAAAHRRPALVGLLAVALAAVPVGVYVWQVAQRVGYPYELNWLEGGAVELANRVLDGRGLYAPPSLAYVGFTYTPLYSFLAAAVAEVTGIGFLPLRIVSILGSVLAMGALAAYVRDMSGSWVPGAVAAGIFAACYGLSGDFYDVGRLDSTFLALSLVALWAGRRAGSAWGGVAVGGLAFLAFFTKQVGLVAVGPALVAALAWRPRVAVAALATLVLLAGASTLILDAATGGWYRYYVLSELAGQPENPPQILGFWTMDLYGNLRSLTLLAGLGALAVLRRGRPRWAALAAPAYDLAAALGLLVCAWVSVIHSGGYLNVLMPAYAVAAGLGGWAWGALARRGWFAALVATGLVAWQFHGLVIRPSEALPARGDRMAGAALERLIARLPGPVLVLRHPWYGTELGKGAFAQSDGITEVLRSHGPRGARVLRANLTGALQRDGVRAVLLDVAPPAWLAPQLAAHFRLVSTHVLPQALVPPTDIDTSPAFLYLRRNG